MSRAGRGQRGRLPARVPRWVGVVVASALLGVVTTVGVAWWSAWSAEGGSVWVAGRWLGMPATAGDDLFKYTVVRSGSAVADAVEAHVVSLEPAAVYDAFAGRASEVVRVPRLNVLNNSGQAHTAVWSEADRGQVERARPARGRDVFRVDWVFGWPWRGMSASARAERPAVYPNPNLVAIEGLVVESDGIVVDATGAGIGSGAVVLPVRPVWPAFAWNWVLAAVVWVVVLTLPRVVWRAVRGEHRRRRGRCPACGYVLGGRFGEGCPECGWGRGTR